MPEISRFYGIIIGMYNGDQNGKIDIAPEYLYEHATAA